MIAHLVCFLTLVRVPPPPPASDDRRCLSLCASCPPANQMSTFSRGGNYLPSALCCYSNRNDISSHCSNCSGLRCNAGLAARQPALARNAREPLAPSDGHTLVPVSAAARVVSNNILLYLIEILGIIIITVVDIKDRWRTCKKREFYTL